MATLAPAPSPRPPTAPAPPAPHAPRPGTLQWAVARHAGPARLVARPGGEHAQRPPRIVVAVEDGPGASALVAVAGAIAAACGGHVQLIHVAGGGYGSQTRRRLAELSIDLIALTRAEPIVDVLRGADVAAAIAGFASSSAASLLVVGRRAGSRPDPIGERVAGRAPCSVLVVPAAAAA